MAVLWHDERLDPEAIIKILERERRAWMEMASELERMKPLLISGDVAQQATNHVHDCRARAEALRRLVARMCEQFNLPNRYAEK